MTGLRADAVPAGAALSVRGRQIASAVTFSSVLPGTAFWYVNSNGLIEIAVNMGRADEALSLSIGRRFRSCEHRRSRHDKASSGSARHRRHGQRHCRTAARRRP
ncbi:MAG: SAM hydroxide adenosyltransferase [Aliidongia sp.]